MTLPVTVKEGNRKTLDKQIPIYVLMFVSLFLLFFFTVLITWRKDTQVYKIQKCPVMQPCSKKSTYDTTKRPLILPPISFHVIFVKLLQVLIESLQKNQTTTQILHPAPKNPPVAAPFCRFSQTTESTDVENSTQNPQHQFSYSNENGSSKTTRQ